MGRESNVIAKGRKQHTKCAPASWGQGGSGGAGAPPAPSKWRIACPARLEFADDVIDAIHAQCETLAASSGRSLEGVKAERWIDLTAEQARAAARELEAAGREFLDRQRYVARCRVAMADARERFTPDHARRYIERTLDAQRRHEAAQRRLLRARVNADGWYAELVATLRELGPVVRADQARAQRAALQAADVARCEADRAAEVLT